MPDTDSIALIERFHAAVISNDAAALRELLADDAFWIITGRSALAGEHKGRDAIVALVARMHELSGGTFRAFRDDSHDVITSDYHAVLADRFLAERDRRQLDSHQAIFVHTKDGRIASLLHYFFDQHAFDAFWS